MGGLGKRNETAITVGMNSPRACRSGTRPQCRWADELDQIRKKVGSRSQLASFMSPLFPSSLNSTLVGRAIS